MNIILGELINSHNYPSAILQDIIFKYQNQELSDNIKKDTIQLDAHIYIVNGGALLCLNRLSKKALDRYGDGYGWLHFYYYTINYHEFYYAKVYSKTKTGTPNEIFYNENRLIKPENIELDWWN